jgi:hypothetical protein
MRYGLRVLESSVTMLPGGGVDLVVLRDEGVHEVGVAVVLGHQAGDRAGP